MRIKSRIKSIYLIIVFITASVSLTGNNGLNSVAIKDSVFSAKSKIQKFYFVHQIFADAFYMTNLSKSVNQREMDSIVDLVYTNLNERTPIILNINTFDNQKAVLNFSILEEKNGNRSLIMKTNYIQSSKQYSEDLNNASCFVRLYFIKGSKLVYRKDLFSPEEEENRKKKGEPTLAEYYLFDDKTENDTIVPSIIKKILTDKSSDPKDVLYANLYGMQYSLFKEDFKEAEIKLASLKKYFNENSNIIPKGYDLIVKLGEIEYELNK